MIPEARVYFLLASVLYLQATSSYSSKTLLGNGFPRPARCNFSESPNHSMSASGEYRGKKVVTVENKEDDMCIPFPFNVSSRFSVGQEIEEGLHSTEGFSLLSSSISLDTANISRYVGCIW
ncbi:hypothetical protein BT93_E1370 [Corymbia citriodora subsp. variegata]|nr:hypothetical protein BT93_E1370 [Corymbia citriodora subsp. variegata]